MKAFKQLFSRWLKADESTASQPPARHSDSERLFYAMALGRIAGFFLPLKEFRAVNWKVRPVSASQQQSLACRGFEFRLDGQAAGCLATSENSAIGQALARRSARPLASTYFGIDTPEFICHEAEFQAKIACWLTTVVDPQEMVLNDPAGLDAPPFEFSIGLDERVLDTLLDQEARHADERDSYPTYIECQVVTAWHAMVGATAEEKT